MAFGEELLRYWNGGSRSCDSDKRLDAGERLNQMAYIGMFFIFPVEGVDER